MNYLEDLKKELKRLKQVQKYDIKRLSAKSNSKYNYYEEGMKQLLKDQETIDNYMEFLNNYNNILNEKSMHIDKLFDEIKTMRKLKF